MQHQTNPYIGTLPVTGGTQLQYHPTRSNILLSGSTDGLVNIYDTTVTDEDEALVQVINHGSVHHAGFLSERTIFALSHDEHFSVYPATDPDDASQEPEPVHFGDVREPLGCEYVAQLCVGAQGPYIAAGNKMYVSCLFVFVFVFVFCGKNRACTRSCCACVFCWILVIFVGSWVFANSCLAVTTVSILSHLFLVRRGSSTGIICGACPVLIARRLCARCVWMNRYVFQE